MANENIEFIVIDDSESENNILTTQESNETISENDQNKNVDKDTNSNVVGIRNDTDLQNDADQVVRSEITHLEKDVSDAKDIQAANISHEVLDDNRIDGDNGGKLESNSSNTLDVVLQTKNDDVEKENAENLVISNTNDAQKEKQASTEVNVNVAIEDSEHFDEDDVEKSVSSEAGIFDISADIINDIINIECDVNLDATHDKDKQEVNNSMDNTTEEQQLGHKDSVDNRDDIENDNLVPHDNVCSNNSNDHNVNEITETTESNDMNDLNTVENSSKSNTNDATDDDLIVIDNSNSSTSAEIIIIDIIDEENDIEISDSSQTQQNVVANPFSIIADKINEKSTNNILEPKREKIIVSTEKIKAKTATKIIETALWLKEYYERFADELSEIQQEALEWAKRNLNVQVGDPKTSDNQLYIPYSTLVENLKKNSATGTAATLGIDMAKKICKKARWIQKVIGGTKKSPADLLPEKARKALEWANRNANVSSNEILNFDHMLNEAYQCADLLQSLQEARLTKSYKKHIIKLSCFLLKHLKCKNKNNLSVSEITCIDWATRNRHVKVGDVLTKEHDFPRKESSTVLKILLEQLELYKLKPLVSLRLAEKDEFQTIRQLICSFDSKFSIYYLSESDREQLKLAQTFLHTSLPQAQAQKTQPTKKNFATTPPLTHLRNSTTPATSTASAATTSHSSRISPTPLSKLDRSLPYHTYKKREAYTAPRYLPPPPPPPPPTTACSVTSNKSLNIPSTNSSQNAATPTTPCRLRISREVYTAARYLPTPPNPQSSTSSSITSNNPTTLKRQLSYEEIPTSNTNSPKRFRRRDLPPGYIVLTVKDVGPGDGTTLAANWKKVQEALLHVFKDVLLENPGPPPICRELGWHKGQAKLVACADKRSAQLYWQAIQRLGEVWPGARLRIVPKNQINERPRSRAWIPAEPSTPQEVMDIIRLCNPSLPTSDWKVAKTSEISNERRQATIILNRDSLPQLIASKGEINYGFGSIFIKIYKCDLWMVTKAQKSQFGNVTQNSFSEKDMVDLTCLADSDDDSDLEEVDVKLFEGD